MSYDVETTALVRDGISVLVDLQRRVVNLREYSDKLEKNSREDFALRVKLEDRITDLERQLGDAEAAAS